MSHHQRQSGPKLWGLCFSSAALCTLNSFSLITSVPQLKAEPFPCQSKALIGSKAAETPSGTPAREGSSERTFQAIGHG